MLTQVFFYFMLLTLTLAGGIIVCGGFPLMQGHSFFIMCCGMLYGGQQQFKVYPVLIKIDYCPI